MYVVGGKRQFLIFFVAVIVVAREFAAALGGYHFLHQLYRGVVFTAVMFASCGHCHFVKTLYPFVPSHAVTVRPAVITGNGGVCPVYSQGTCHHYQ